MYKKAYFLFVDNSLLLVDNLWIKYENARGKQEIKYFSSIRFYYTIQKGNKILFVYTFYHK